MFEREQGNYFENYSANIYIIVRSLLTVQLHKLVLSYHIISVTGSSLTDISQRSSSNSFIFLDDSDYI